jgi:hypothetical protein
MDVVVTLVDGRKVEAEVGEIPAQRVGSATSRVPVKLPRGKTAAGWLSWVLERGYFEDKDGAAHAARAILSVEPKKAKAAVTRPGNLT